MATRSTEAVPNEAGQPGQVGGTSQDWTGSGLLAGARVRHVPGTGSPWRWFFSGIWLVYLIQPVAQLFHRHDVVWIVGGLVITLAFCGLYLSVLMFSDTRPTTGQRWPWISTIPLLNSDRGLRSYQTHRRSLMSNGRAPPFSIRMTTGRAAAWATASS